MVMVTGATRGPGLGPYPTVKGRSSDGSLGKLISGRAGSPKTCTSGSSGSLLGSGAGAHAKDGPNAGRTAPEMEGAGARSPTGPAASRGSAGCGRDACIAGFGTPTGAAARGSKGCGPTIGPAAGNIAGGRAGPAAGNAGPTTDAWGPVGPSAGPEVDIIAGAAAGIDTRATSVLSSALGAAAIVANSPLGAAAGADISADGLAAIM